MNRSSSNCHRVLSPAMVRLSCASAILLCASLWIMAPSHAQPSNRPADTPMTKAPPAKEKVTEPNTWSPLGYDKLGATPKVRPPKRPGAGAKTPDAKAPVDQPKAKASDGSNASKQPG